MNAKLLILKVLTLLVFMLFMTSLLFSQEEVYEDGNEGTTENQIISAGAVGKYKRKISPGQRAAQYRSYTKQWEGH
ncbi:MAG: hypothetical protein HC896_12905 [Bacteroidales bacterium]|nr:hypothetical protein [Bacteroidales bacterium]